MQYDDGSELRLCARTVGVKRKRGANMSRRSLLQDDGDEEEAGSSPPRLGFNEEYAKRFEHNKKREDLHRLQELKKKGLDVGGGDADDDDDEESSEDEDEDGLLPRSTDEKIYETLTKIKARDPSIYSSGTKFFGDEGEEDGDEVGEGSDEESDEEEEERRKLQKQKRPMYLKDVNARQLLEGGAEQVEDGDEEPEVRKKPGYFNEQDELKKAFLRGVREAEGDEEGDESDEGDLLSVKKKSKEELERDARDTAEAIEEAERRVRDGRVDKRLENYFGQDDELDANERFLKDYLLNKGWINEKQKPSYPAHTDEFADVSEEEDELEKQDEFERKYNFRYENGTVDEGQVRIQPRIIENSVRKKSETRKKQRESKKERLSEAERARREELKRLKNVKKKEVMEKLEKIRAIAGMRDEGQDAAAILREEDLEEDFEPDEYDKKMKDAFGEDYYDAEDPHFAGSDEDADELEKPDFDAEDEILGLASEKAGYAAVKSKLDGQSSSQPEEKAKKVKEKKEKVKVAFEEKLLIDKHLDEYYKLDYEDVVGDVKTRFRYREVKPNRYGLRIKDILGLEDKELNQFVALKKLAPYAAQEWEARRPVPRVSSKQRRKNALNSEAHSKKDRQRISEGSEAPSTEVASKDRPVSDAENGIASTAAAEDAVAIVTVGGSKRNRKRKRAGPLSGISQSRLLSYQPKTKKKEGKKKAKKKVKSSAEGGP